MLGDGEHDGTRQGARLRAREAHRRADSATGATRCRPALPTAPITGEGRILGTVAYMSPEQAEGKAIDARSDLFSLGVILYEMATGQRPFTGDTSISIISSIVKDTPKSVTELNPALPRDLGRIIRRALTKDPERRYQTAKDLRNDLEELKASLDSGELQTATMASGSLPVGASGAAREIAGWPSPRGSWSSRSLVESSTCWRRGVPSRLHPRRPPIGPGSADHAVDDERHRGTAGDLSRRQVRRVHPAFAGAGVGRRWFPHRAYGSVRWRRPVTSRSSRRSHGYDRRA